MALRCQCFKCFTSAILPGVNMTDDWKWTPVPWISSTTRWPWRKSVSSSTRGESIPQVGSTTLAAEQQNLLMETQLQMLVPFVLLHPYVLDNGPGFGCQSELELRVAEAARRQYNKLKMQTKAEIRQTIDQLLVGEFIVRLREQLASSGGSCCVSLIVSIVSIQKENCKRWTMKLDICAPQVIFPDDFQSGDPLLVIVDLGRILLTNSEGNASKLFLFPHQMTSSLVCKEFDPDWTLFLGFSLSRWRKNQLKNHPTWKWRRERWWVSDSSCDSIRVSTTWISRTCQNAGTFQYHHTWEYLVLPG